MKFSRRLLALALACALPLSGCNTSSALSDLGSDTKIDTMKTASTKPTNITKAAVLNPPVSDHVSQKGDQSTRLIELGKQSFASQNYGNSEKYFRQAVELRADSLSAWAGLAAAYDQLGNFKFADRAYQQLASIAGKSNAKVLNNMGYSYLLRGDYKQARLYLNRALKADPGLDHAANNLKLLTKVLKS